MKLASNENPRGPSPARARGHRGRGGRSHALSGRQRLRAQGGARAAAWRRSGADRARQRLQRHPRTRDAGVPASGRRGHLLAARVRRVSARHAGARRHAASKCRRAISGTTCRAMRAAITPRTRIVFVANPNNPTGTFVAAAERSRRSSRRCRATCWSCSTRRTTSISNRPIAATASAGSSRYPNLAGVADVFQGATDWRRCASATASCMRAWPTCSIACASRSMSMRSRRRRPSRRWRTRLCRREPRAQPRGTRAAGRRASRRSASTTCRRTAISCWSRSATPRRSISALLAQGVIVRPGRELRVARVAARFGRPARRRTSASWPRSRRRCGR